MIRNMRVAYHPPATLAATLGLAAAAWVVSVPQMRGMDMGVATKLGPFASFVALWAAMMAAMMLPGLVPAIVTRARRTGPVRAVVPFVASYLVVWTLVGALIYVPLVLWRAPEVMQELRSLRARRREASGPPAPEGAEAQV